MLFEIIVDSDKWESITELVIHSRPSLSSIHLRAFYAVELMYYKALPMALWSAGNRHLHQEFSRLRFERSLVGLDELEERLRKAKRHLGARRIVTAVKRDKSNNSQQVLALLERPALIMDNCQRAVEILKRCLRKDDVKGLAQVGELLGRSLAELAEDSSVISSYIVTILQVTTENPVSPWQTKSQV